MIKLALSNKITAIPFEKTVAFAKTTGFDGIDYIASMEDLFFSPKKMISLSKKYKIPVISLHQQLPLVLYTPPFLYRNIFSLEKFFPSARIINFHLSSFLMPFFQNKIPYGDTLLMGKLSMSLESNPPLFPLTLYPKSTYDPMSFSQFCTRNNLLMTLDTSHVARAKYDIIDFYKKNKDSIHMIHLSDFDGKTEHLPLGDGKLPILPLLKLVKNNSKIDIISFEISNFKENLSSEEKLIKIKKSFQFVYAALSL